MLDGGKHALLVVGVLDLLQLYDALLIENLDRVEPEVVSTADCPLSRSDVGDERHGLGRRERTEMDATEAACSECPLEYEVVETAGTLASAYGLVSGDGLIDGINAVFELEVADGRALS